jgi:hypothetical protein
LGVDQKHLNRVRTNWPPKTLKPFVDDIAIKTDITEFLDVLLSTLNSYLSKHKDVIKPIKLDLPTIRSISPKANTMNGYCLKDVGTIALGMDSVIGIESHFCSRPFSIENFFCQTNDL